MSANWSEAKQAAVNLVSTHKLAMDEQQKNHSMMIRRLEENLEKANKEHQTKIVRLEQEHQNELEQLKASLASQQQSETEDRLKQQATLVADLTKKELGLQQQVSELSQELCQVRDRLALLSQRERELQGNIEDSRNTKDELNERLTNKENEATILTKLLPASLELIHFLLRMLIIEALHKIARDFTFSNSLILSFSCSVDFCCEVKVSFLSP